VSIKSIRGQASQLNKNPDNFQIIMWTSPNVIEGQSSKRAKNAQKEIMIMLPTHNAFLRQSMIEALQLGKEASEERGVKIRI
jgi:hypothetical protein